MRKGRKILPILVAAIFALAMFAFAACGGDKNKPKDGKDEVSISVSPTTLALTEGDDAATITATVKGSTANVDWIITSGADTVITIEKSGKICTVTPVGEGSATVRATVAGKYADCSVTVAPDSGQGDDVSVTLDQSTLSIAEDGNAATVNATVTGSTDPVVWTVTPNDDSVVTISGSGNACTVTPVAEGTATLTATVGTAHDECEITVTASGSEPGAVSVTLDQSTLSIAEDGSAATVNATVTGSTDPVVWTVDPDDDSVVTISGSGNACTVTPIAEGTATLTATVGSAHDECEITVTASGSEPGTVSVTVNNPTLSIEEGNSSLILAMVTGSTDPVVWTVNPSDGSIVRIDNSDDNRVCKFTGIAEGTATLTATVGSAHDECEITVTASGSNPQVPNITTWETVGDAIYGEVNEQGQDYIWHHIFFNDAVEQEYEFDSYEATVKLDGDDGEVVTMQPFNSEAAEAHTYHLQVRIKGNRYQTAEFTILFKKDGTTVATGTYTRAGDREITLDSAVLSISKGQTETINITSINGSNDFTDKTITWTIADTEGTGVATIPDDSHGASVVVTAAAAGKATLTCTVGEGPDAFSKTCAITVVEGQVTITAVDITDKYTFNNKFTTGTGEAIQVYFNLQDANYAELVAQIVPASTTVTVKMDGNDSTCKVLRKEWQSANLYNLWIQIEVEEDWSHDYEFRFSFKNAKGDEVAYGEHTETAPKDIHLDKTTLNLTLEEGQTVTGTIAATKTSSVSGDISWSVDQDSVATITDNGDGTVTVTAVAKGTAVVTATADGVSKTCTVNVINKGDSTPVLTITDFTLFEGPYGENYYKFRFEESDANVNKYPDIKASFDHTNVDGTLTAHKEFFQGGGAKTYIVTVKFNSAPVSGTTYKIDLCDVEDNILATFSWTPA